MPAFRVRAAFFCLLICLALSRSVPAAPVSVPPPVENFEFLDDFESGTRFSADPHSLGRVTRPEGAGLHGTKAALFETSEAVGWVAARWPMRFGGAMGIVFQARSIQGEASLQVKLIERDGDEWIAWVALDSDWRLFGFPFDVFEFHPAGNGLRERGMISLFEIRAVLRDPPGAPAAGASKAAAVDNLGLTTNAEALRLSRQIEYAESLLESLRAIPLDNAEPAEAIRRAISDANLAPDNAAGRVKAVMAGLDPLLKATLAQADARALEYESLRPGEQWDAGRAAALARRHAEPYRERLREDLAQLREFELPVSEMEKALVYARRTLDFFNTAVDLLRSPRPESAGAPTHFLDLRNTLLPGRARVLLNGPWDFVTQPRPQAAPGSLYTSIRVPHGIIGQTLGVNFAAGPDANPADPYLWLRRRVYIPAQWAGRKVLLDFRGAGHYLEVYVNGRYCGNHVGGFAPFQIDISDAILLGQDNEIRLWVVNSGATRAGNPDPRVNARDYPGVLPGPGPNFYLAMGGPAGDNAGLWDDVALETRAPAYVENAFIRTSVAENRLTARVALRNDSDTDAALALEAFVLDDAGAPVFAFEAQTVELPGGSATEVNLEREWNDYVAWGPGAPYGQPKLYRLRLRLADENGRTVDETDETFGFREFEIRSTGFFLNGLRIRLQGVTLSASEAGKTWERANREYFLQFLRIARDANINFLLLQSEFPAEWLELCDAAGMLCAPAAPVAGFVDRAPEDLFGLDDFDDPLWRENGRRQLADWARAHTNRPSVVMRASETGSFAQDMFWAHGGGAPSQARLMREAREAAFDFDRAIRAVDPTRPVIHLDTAYADFDAGFAVCARSGPVDVDNWRRDARGRPLIALLQPAASGAPSADDLRSPDRAVAARATDRLAKWMSDAILALQNADVPGVILPGLDAALFSTAQREWMGPWQALTSPELAHYATASGDGETAIHIDARIPIAWPAISGPGTRAEAFDLADGISTWINGIDASRPPMTPNPVYDAVRRAFDLTPALAAPRWGEVVVQLPQGDAAAGALAILQPTARPSSPEPRSQPLAAIPAEQGALADSRGRLWFVVDHPGPRALSYWIDGRRREIRVDIPEINRIPAPGFGHVSVIVND